MVSTWQKALAECDLWLESLRRARSEIEATHGSFSDLVRKSRIEVKEEDGTFTLKMNTEARLLWKLHDEIERMGEDFIVNHLHLGRDSHLHHLFINFWIESGFPEAMRNDESLADGEPLTQEAHKNRKAWAERKVVKENGKFRIIDSVHWYHDSVEPKTIAKLLATADWPKTADWVLKKAKGGRPRSAEYSRLYPEAVVCAVLKDQQHLTNKQIAAIFGWKLQRDSYGNQSMSNTAYERIKLGRKILDSSGRIPTRN